MKSTNKDIGQAKHDIKNALATIKILVQLLHRDFSSGQPDDVKTTLEKIDDKVDELAQRINAF
jgi:light-regulated signal transduction histidine kinase (bacteriophytochrome)